MRSGCRPQRRRPRLRPQCCWPCVLLPSLRQITAHVREKLHCVGQERGELEAAAARREAAAGAARAELATAKLARERLQRRREGLAQGWRIVSDPGCLADMAAQAARLAELQAQAAQLEARWVERGGAART